MPYGKAVGTDGEDTAADYLRSLGAEITARNFNCPVGEIDIICVLNGTLVFCEVKRRMSLRYGAPAEAVTPAKQKKIIKAAEWFLAAHGPYEMPMRFDVMEIMPGTIRYIPGAFDASRP